jgi:hypothetical protein
MSMYFIYAQVNMWFSLQNLDIMFILKIMAMYLLTKFHSHTIQNSYHI